jgi:hypothetical protein
MYLIITAIPKPKITIQEIEMNIYRREKQKENEPEAKVQVSPGKSNQ